ncbi:acyl-CoA carboxylase subunit beta [Aureibacillus halotolerans]|uniref:Propionyl-CoA carboxylase beta chain n=1 Tax=Aureibacillus halotolerans TaxID=1508390 RepID=A0A4R6UEV1_9BACI|nr:carboxyl transferase domain-containing protein [Aureibacillus halotolerans]TDQ41624.1 propionyl-CoA carboxylase beta chain [Aureibacillus halotolerans]
MKIKNNSQSIQRIAQIVDDGSFQEIMSGVTTRVMVGGLKGDGLIAGTGLISGYPIAVFSQDFNYMGGSVGEMHAQKMAAIIRLARELHMPLVGLIDSGGARIQEGILALEGYGSVFQELVHASGEIPLISVMLGVCAGGAVYGPALTDIVIMNEAKAQMFITGPRVIQQATGEKVKIDAYGSPAVHAVLSGTVDIMATDESNAIERAKQLLLFHAQPKVSANRTIEKQALVLPSESKKTYDMKSVISYVLDDLSFMEMKPRHAMNVITGFGRLFGQSVGIIANQPKYKAGVLDILASEKAARFIQLCNAWRIPVLSFMDAVGFYPSTQEETNGLIRKGARLLYAFGKATVPKITLIVRKGYGGAYVAMNCKSMGADAVFALDTAEISVMGIEAARSVLNEKHMGTLEASDGLTDGLKYGFVDDVLQWKEVALVLSNTLARLDRKRVDVKPTTFGNPPV